MEFIIGESVVSTICNKIFGKVKKIIDNESFILQVFDKKILCHKDYYIKFKENK